ncbi:hypothetical protein LCGC14_2463040, partial [marine sediment metagenome]
SIAAFSSLTQIIKSIKIPNGLIDLNLDIYNPEEIEVSIPYYIQNHGIYDLNDMIMEVDISVNYIDISSRNNITAQIFSKYGVLPNCKAFSTLIGDFSGSFTNFNISAVIAFIQNSDIFEPFSFLIDINFHLKYFFNLIQISIILDDVGLIGE